MTPPRQITILLAEDHTIVRQGLRALLNADVNLRVVGEARTGREAVKLAQTLRPDVIVMDIAMPQLNGLEATRQILLAVPATKVLILSAHNDDEYVERVLAAGAAGYLLKQSSADILAEAIKVVVKGHPVFSPAIARRLGAKGGRRRSLLTSREEEVLQLVAEGAPNKQVAAELGISIKTVEKHRQHLMDKLDIHDTAGLTRYAIAAGVVESSVQKTTI